MEIRSEFREILGPQGYCFKLVLTAIDRSTKTGLFVVLHFQIGKTLTGGLVFCGLRLVWSQSFSSFETRPVNTTQP